MGLSKIVGILVLVSLSTQSRGASILDIFNCKFEVKIDGWGKKITKQIIVDRGIDYVKGNTIGGLTTGSHTSQIVTEIKKGRYIRIKFVTHFLYEDGKATKQRVYYDFVLSTKHHSFFAHVPSNIYNLDEWVSIPEGHLFNSSDPNLKLTMLGNEGAKLSCDYVMTIPG